MKVKIAIIAGAGPAGLTAAFELLEKTDIKPIIFEMTDEIGGISKTVNYKGNRIDIGGHRFFSKSEKVMDWWMNVFPLQGKPSHDDIICNRKKSFSQNPSAPNPEETDRVMLIRERLSRIFFLQTFFDYPITLKAETLLKLGLLRTTKIGLSYIKARLSPIKNEASLEDFFINRFGKELYLTFFKDYTEKVWGVPCNKIKPEWGAQRVKGLSISKAILHAVKSSFSKDASIDQKQTETSLIEQFLYPKHGPGQLWEEIANTIRSKGGEIYLNQQVNGLEVKDNTVTGVIVRDMISGEEKNVSGNYFFSTMPVKDLINSITPQPPQQIKQVANGLMYRDFITVGLLVKKLSINNETQICTVNNIVPDNWIYIQEREVKLGRLQIFNNWSPYMVKDKNTVWIGLEYFCNEGDELWEKENSEFAKFAIDELAKIKIINKEDVLDNTVIRVPKTYPAYFGTYECFQEIRDYIDRFENLFLIGRNGMHRYNNTDHSMLTAMVAVENISKNITGKDNIWEVNTEQEYHEKK